MTGVDKAEVPMLEARMNYGASTLGFRGGSKVSLLWGRRVAAARVPTMPSWSSAGCLASRRSTVNSSAGGRLLDRVAPRSM